MFNKHILKKYIFLLILNHVVIISYCQKSYIENFDNKVSLSQWKIKTNGVWAHTDSFNFDGTTFKKGSKDSFIIFYDTSKNWSYYFDISRKFNVKPYFYRTISFASSLFSMDSSLDYMIFKFSLFDKKNNRLFTSSIPSYKKLLPINIYGSSIDISDIKDSIWKLADSIEISFHFNPMNPYNFIERIGVIDEIYFSDLLEINKVIFNKNFKIFPNPAKNILNIEIQSISNELNNIEIYNLSGIKVYSNISAEKNITVNTSSFATGIYIIKVYNKQFVVNQKFIKE